MQQQELLKCLCKLCKCQAQATNSDPDLNKLISRTKALVQLDANDQHSTYSFTDTPHHTTLAHAHGSPKTPGPQSIIVTAPLQKQGASEKCLHPLWHEICWKLNCNQKHQIEKLRHKIDIHLRKWQYGTSYVPSTTNSPKYLSQAMNHSTKLEKNSKSSTRKCH